MAKYTSDANLIQGAATAYKNWENVPGIYEGLDKITEAGEGMMKTAFEDYEAEQKKKEEEAKALEEKENKSKEEWAAIAAPVYAAAGSFLKPDGEEYKLTIKEVQALKKDYINAKESKDPQLIAKVSTRFDAITKEITATKAFREKIAEPDVLSNSMTTENRDFLTTWLKEDYTVKRNEDTGKKEYTIGSRTLTLEDMEKLYDPKDDTPFAAFAASKHGYLANAGKIDEENLKADIGYNVIPQTPQGLSAFLNDVNKGNGQTFTQTISMTNNKAAIIDDIKNTIFDDDNNGTITENEWKNFTDVIVNRHNDFWIGNGGEQGWKDHAHRIVTEQYSNSILNAHKLKYPDTYKEQEKKLLPHQIVGSAAWINYQKYMDIKHGNPNDPFGTMKKASYVHPGWKDAKSLYLKPGDKQAAWSYFKLSHKDGDDYHGKQAYWVRKGGKWEAYSSKEAHTNKEKPLATSELKDVIYYETGVNIERKNANKGNADDLP